MERRIRAIVAVVALACTALLIPKWLGVRTTLDDLPAAPTVSYGAPGYAPAANLRKAIERVGPDVVDSNVEWRLLVQRSAGSLATDRADALIARLRADTRVDIGHARYVLLDDNSPVLPIGPVTTLPPLRHRAAWLVPVRTLGIPTAAGQHDYLVLDAGTGTLLERLAVAPVDPFAICTGAPPALFRIGQLLCMLRHAGDPRAEAHRSVP